MLQTTNTNIGIWASTYNLLVSISCDDCQIYYTYVFDFSIQREREIRRGAYST